MLSEQLSVLLVAYTIEYDNEFEHHMPNKTTAFGSGGPVGAEIKEIKEIKRTWLTSKVMWANFMRYVPPEGVPLELVKDLPANPGGLKRWGFIAVGEASGSPGSSGLVKATRAGRWAQGIWQRLDEGIDRRWESRFGAGLIGELRAALAELARPVAAGLPLYLPVVGFADGMRSRFRDLRELGLASVELGGYDLSGLLSAVLLAFTLEYESLSKLPLPISANVLRVIPDGGVRVSAVPRLGGVSKEGTTSALGFLERSGYVELGPDQSGRRGQFVRPTERGRRARDGRAAIAARVEAGWKERFGAAAVGRLRDVLTAVASHRAAAGAAGGGGPSLALGLKPYPDGRRSGRLIWPRPRRSWPTRPAPCPGIPWSCTAAATPTAARAWVPQRLTHPQAGHSGHANCHPPLLTHPPQKSRQPQPRPPSSYMRGTLLLPQQQQSAPHVAPGGPSSPADRAAGR